MQFKEDFLIYVWRYGLFEKQEPALKTIAGETLEIVLLGERNYEAGPDFYNAKIKIGETLLAGTVEMHVKASEWLKHEHQKDEAYNNVILHVVYEADCPVERADGNYLPTLELANKISPVVYRNYQRLQLKHQWIPCEQLLDKADDFTWLSWKDRLLIERLARKTNDIKLILEQNTNDWQNTFYQQLARSYGTKINADAFQQLARSLPLTVLAKHKDNLFQIEALLFGQAGLLEKNNFKEDYPLSLKKEYRYLQQKFDLQAMKKASWKFSPLRPPNLPTIRIAQFAALIHNSTHLFSKILKIDKPEDYIKLFQCQPSEYWQTHYVFDKASKAKSKAPGKNTLNGILINTLAPLLFIYGKEMGLPEFKNKAFALLEALPAEKNSIVEGWSKLGQKAKTAYDTQALLQLKNEYCNAKKCLECAVGNKILLSK